MKELIKRALGPIFYRLHDREAGTQLELKFWDKWVADKGGVWGDEFERRFNPDTEVRVHHQEILEQFYSDDMSILDVGSGPVSNIGWNFNGKALNLTASDPNADAYNELLDSNQLNPPVRTIKASGESLSAELDQKFDWVNCDNALDHAVDPNQALLEMVKVLKPNGIISLFHEVNEGVNEGYRGYHKWNLCPIGSNGFAIWGPNQRQEYIGEFEGRKISTSIHDDRFLVVMKPDAGQALQSKAA